MRTCTIFLNHMDPSTMQAKRATLEEMGLGSEKAVTKHILQENVWECSLIPETKGEQSSNPWRGCPSTGRVGKPKKCRCAAEFHAPPARRARPTGSCHRFLSLFEKSGARRVSTKMSRSATKTEGQTGSSIQDQMLRLLGWTIRPVRATKFYNKVVSKFKAREERETFRGHLAYWRTVLTSTFAERCGTPKCKEGAA